MSVGHHMEIFIDQKLFVYCSESASADFKQCYIQSVPINCTTGNGIFYTYQIHKCI